MSGEASASFEMAETQSESLCRLRKNSTGYMSLHIFGCSSYFFPRAFGGQEKISYFTIKGSREWHLNGHNSNNTKEGGGGGKKKSNYHDECCIVKALCDPGGHLFRNLVGTGAEGTSQLRYLNRDILAESGRKYAYRDVKIALRAYKQEQDSKLMLRLIEVRRPKKPSSPLQHTIRIPATFRQ